MSLVLFLGFAPHVFAQGFTALAPIPGLTSPEATSVVNADTLANFFNNLYKYLIGLAATLAVIQIIWAGINIAMHQDNVSSITDEKGKIRNAIFGLILVLSPVLVFSIINPSILNLSLNLPKLETATTMTIGTAPGSATGPAFPTSAFQQNCAQYNDSSHSIISPQSSDSCSKYGGTDIDMICCPNLDANKFRCCVAPKQ